MSLGDLGFSRLAIGAGGGFALVVLEAIGCFLFSLLTLCLPSLLFLRGFELPILFDVLFVRL